MIRLIPSSIVVWSILIAIAIYYQSDLFDIFLLTLTFFIFILFRYLAYGNVPINKIQQHTHFRRFKIVLEKIYPFDLVVFMVIYNQIIFRAISIT